MKTLLIILISACTLTVFGQQESQFANTFINPYLVNPAAGGLRDLAQIEILGRAQWIGYDGHARNYVFSANTQLYGHGKGNKEYNPQGDGFQVLPDYSTSKTKHVVGLKAMNDNIGIFTKNSVHGSYAYHLPFSKKLNVGLGLSAGFGNFSLESSEINNINQNDETYLGFLSGRDRQSFLDVQSGLVLYGSQFLLGISTSQTFRNELDNFTPNSSLARHIYINGNFRLIEKTSFSLSPVFVLKLAENAPASLDIGMQANFQKSFWVNLNYRTSNALGLGLGINLPKNIYVSYAYELGIAKLSTQNSSTHQLQLGLYLGHNRNVKKEFKEIDKEQIKTAE